MSVPTLTKQSQPSATRSRSRSATDRSDFAVRAKTKPVSKSKSLRAAVTSVSSVDEEAASIREVTDLKLRIRALNATNLNLRRRIKELEAGGKS